MCVCLKWPMFINVLFLQQGGWAGALRVRCIVACAPTPSMANLHARAAPPAAGPRLDHNEDMDVNVEDVEDANVPLPLAPPAALAGAPPSAARSPPGVPGAAGGARQVSAALAAGAGGAAAAAAAAGGGVRPAHSPGQRRLSDGVAEFVGAEQDQRYLVGSPVSFATRLPDLQVGSWGH